MGAMCAELAKVLGFYKDRELGIFVLSMSSLEETLKKKSARRSWNSFFDTAIEPVTKVARDRKVLRNIWTNNLLMSYMKKGEGRVKFAWRLAALDVWWEKRGPMMYLNSTAEIVLSLPVTCGR